MDIICIYLTKIYLYFEFIKMYLANMLTNIVSANEKNLHNINNNR